MRFFPRRPSWRALPWAHLPSRSTLALIGAVMTAMIGAPLGGAPPAWAQSAGAKNAVAAKPYLREDLASDVVRLEESLRKESKAQLAQGKTAAQLSAESAAAANGRNYEQALSLAAAAIAADPKPAAHWSAYVRLEPSAEKPEAYRNYTLRERATTAAYAVFQRSQGAPEQAAALASLGETFARREMWRPALDAYAASLALVEDAPTRARYADLREKYGFRILSYDVDNDSASPRICFKFSEPLARKADFAPYVSISGAASGALSAEDKQLCLEGVNHGQSYKIALRQGLPSAVGETLLKNADYEIQVRDRSPQARFTGKNYVLPRVGQEGLPVVTVNASKVRIDLFRIGERSLAPTLRGEDFLKQISGSRAYKIAQEDGVKVWSGTLETKNDLNKDVVTAFPVLEAAPKLEAGVYVMTARLDGSGTDRDGEEDYADRATQWFIVSDIGLTALSGGDGVTALARSLATAEPKAGVELKLIAKNNEVLGTAKTDARGVASFDPGLARGTGGMAPSVLVASDAGGDHGFLDLANAAFDLTDRGVAGRLAPSGLDALVFAERGVYRPGETVFLTTLLRDSKGAAAAGLPITLVAKRPDGVEYKRALVEDQGLGGRAFSLSLLSDAPTGSWKVAAYVDPKGQAVGETTFLVEDYMPERLEVTLTPRAKSLRPGQPVEIDVQADFLYGAPGAGLETSGEIAVEAIEDGALAGHPGYVAGVTDEEFETATGELEQTPKTDDKGRALVVATLPEASAPRPLQAKITLRVGETGGRAVERVVTLPIRPAKPTIGVKKLFSGDLAEGAQATFEAIALSSAGERGASKAAVWTLYRVETRYQWHNSDGRWGYEPIKSSKRVADGAFDIPADGPGKIAAPVGWGAYRLDVRSADGEATTSVSFDVGWSGVATAETPDLVDVTLDKKDYAAGETARLTVQSRAAGQGFVAIVSDGVRELLPVAFSQGSTTVQLPVKADWGAGAYALVSVHRPLDAAAKRMPSRAMGLAWFSIDKAAREIGVEIKTEARARPRGALVVPVKLSGLAAGEDAFVTISAVDVGILNLTDYETPEPDDYFFGQKQLSQEVRDLYGFLIDGMQGTRGAIRSGGDGGGKGLEGNRPTQEPLARYSGVLKAGANGEVEARFDLPAFNGAVRVAVAAWSKSKAGSGEADVIVRDAVVAQGTTPRFLSLGDRSRFHLSLDNVEGQAGDYTVGVDLRGPIVAPTEALSKSFKLAQGQKGELTIPVTATGVGRAELDVTLRGPGLEAPQTFAVNVQPGTSDLQRRTVRQLGPNESATISGDLLVDFLPKTGRVSVSLTPFGAIDAAGLLAALDRYPYGCTEQTVSRAMPLLYVNKLAALEGLALDGDLPQRVKEAIERVLSRQDSSGNFGLWSAGGSEDLWLDGFVMDFLTRAREAGYAVPQKSFDLGLERLRNAVANMSDSDRGDGAGMAYAYYALARNGRPVMGDLRYLADTQIENFKTPLGRAQLGAALGLLGDRARAQTLFQSAADQLVQSSDARVSRADYGSKLRDGAGVMALMAESGATSGPALQRVNGVVAEQQSERRYTSTQEKGWMTLAAQALAKVSDGFSVSLDGATRKGALHRSWRDEELAQGAKTLVNLSQAPAQLVVTTSGNPIVPEPAASQGYDVSRAIYRMNGKPLEGAAKQNERFVVVLKVTEREAKYARLLLVDRLPAGLEIDNPKLVESGAIEGLDWFKQDVEPTHAEYRDDRFVAAFDRSGSEAATFSVAYIARAVTPGRYVVPPAVVEDMYRPERFGRTAYGTFEVTGP